MDKLWIRFRGDLRESNNCDRPFWNEPLAYSLGQKKAFFWSWIDFQADCRAKSINDCPFDREKHDRARAGELQSQVK
jgi:hypothetical protein